jgi:hypothetical protein
MSMKTPSSGRSSITHGSRTGSGSPAWRNRVSHKVSKSNDGPTFIVLDPPICLRHWNTQAIEIVGQSDAAFPIGLLFGQHIDRQGLQLMWLPSVNRGREIWNMPNCRVDDQLMRMRRSLKELASDCQSGRATSNNDDIRLESRSSIKGSKVLDVHRAISFCLVCRTKDGGAHGAINQIIRRGLTERGDDFMSPGSSGASSRGGAPWRADTVLPRTHDRCAQECPGWFGTSRPYI